MPKRVPDSEEEIIFDIDSHWTFSDFQFLLAFRYIKLPPLPCRREPILFGENERQGCLSLDISGFLNSFLHFYRVISARGQ